MAEELPTADAPAPGDPIPSQQRQPSGWSPEFSEGAIIEYSCGNCGKIIYWKLWKATYCPHCKAPIFNFPRRKLDCQYHGWGYRDQENVKYVGPSPKAIRKAGPERASTPSPKRRGHARALPGPLCDGPGR